MEKRDLVHPAAVQDPLTTHYQNQSGCQPGLSLHKISYLFRSSGDVFFTRLQHLLIVATDFVSGPKIESDPASWLATRDAYHNWLGCLHLWRDGFGVLAHKVIGMVANDRSYQDDEMAYLLVRKSSCYFWYCICNITREMEQRTVPGSNPVAFRAKCGQWLLLALGSWDSLEVSMIWDLKVLGQEMPPHIREMYFHFKIVRSV